VDRVHSDYANLRRRQQDANAQIQSTHVQPKAQSEYSTYSRIANNHDAKRDGISWPSRHSLGFQGAPAWARHRCDCQSVDNGYGSCIQCQGEPVVNSWEGMVPGATWVWTDRSASKISDRGHWAKSLASAGANQILDKRTCYICSQEFNIYGNEARIRSDLCNSTRCQIGHRNLDDKLPKDDKASARSVL
jgi:hypothetical protein